MGIRSFTITEILIVVAIIGLFTAFSTFFYSAFIRDVEVRENAHELVSLLESKRAGGAYGSTGLDQRGWDGIEVAYGQTGVTEWAAFNTKVENQSNLETLISCRYDAVEVTPNVEGATPYIPGESPTGGIDIPIAFCFITDNNTEIAGLPTCSKDERFISGIVNPPNLPDPNGHPRLHIAFRHPDTHPAFFYGTESGTTPFTCLGNIHRDTRFALEKSVLYRYLVDTLSAQNEVCKGPPFNAVANAKVDCFGKEDTKVRGVKLFLGEEGAESAVIIELSGSAYVL